MQNVFTVPAGVSLARFIMDKAVVTSLKNWDGSYDQAGILENLQEYVRKNSGWNTVEVTYSSGLLEVKGYGDVDPRYNLHVVLALDVTYGRVTFREIYGRLSHLYLTKDMIEELELLKTAQ